MKNIMMRHGNPPAIQALMIPKASREGWLKVVGVGAISASG
jgi:hypothetical protein